MRKPALVGAVLWFAVVSTATAHAEPARASFAGGRGYIRVNRPEPLAAEAVSHFSNVLFLNRCDGGCTFNFGNDNSSTNTSSVGGGFLPEFRWSDAVWDGVVECTRDIFSPFNIVVTDVDPGATEHMEAIVAGEACDLSGSGGWEFQCPFILGVAPFECGYNYIPRSISFTFANDNSYGGGSVESQVNNLCSTIGQEVAHTWGLDHELLASDPMTYLPYNGRRQFADQLVACGEYEGQPHGCGAQVGCGGTPAQQNSVQRIIDRFGASSPTPPTVTITTPADGAQVSPGFQIRAEADETLSRCELRIDSQLVETLDAEPCAFTAPGDLGEGTHQIEVRGYDLQSTPGSASIEVVLGDPCEDDDDCEDEGDGYTCVGGRCVPGSGTPGGLGEECTSDDQCFSGLCLTSGDERRCVESCDLAGDDCPGGFDCLDFDGGGVCWPGAGGEPGGCTTTSSDGRNALPITLGIALAGLLATRRRRRQPRD
jgi:hypothetical protein